VHFWSSSFADSTILNDEFLLCSNAGQITVDDIVFIYTLNLIG
jgi:hypothetical protein